jgi:hypothetical protein
MQQRRTSCIVAGGLSAQPFCFTLDNAVLRSVLVLYDAYLPSSNIIIHHCGIPSLLASFLHVLLPYKARMYFLGHSADEVKK